MTAPHNAPAAADKYYYAAGVAGLPLMGKSREEGVRLAAGWIDDVRRKHTPYATLADAGLGEADLPRLAQKLKGRMCIWGGMNAILTLGEGTPADAERAVEEALAALATDLRFQPGTVVTAWPPAFTKLGSSSPLGGKGP